MPARVDRCVRSLMKDPNFKPKKRGQKKKDAAWALCQWLNQQGHLKDSNADEITLLKQTLSEDIGSSIIMESEIMDDEVIIWKIPI